MIHKNEHPLSGKKVKIKESANEIGGMEILIEDYWDRVSGISWMNANGNPACLRYAMRSGFSNLPIPINNEVVYGKIGSLGYLVHTVELENE